MPITNDPADEYANVKPFAACTVEFDPGEVDLKKLDKETVKQIVKEAFDEAASRAFEQMVDFKRELLTQYKTTQERRAASRKRQPPKA